MREGWVYKKIGDICDVKTGKLDANASNVNGAYPFFTCSKEPLRINSFSYDAECVLIAGNGDLNVKYYNGKFDAYQRTYILTIKKDITDVSVHFLYLFFLLYVDVLRKNSIGGVIKYIKLGDITDAKIHIPSIAEQERIISELDLLSGIIEKKKKEQLKEYDKLAQSIFYDMFGDPIENPKGWEIVPLNSVGTIARGVSKHRPRNAPELLGNYMPLIQTGDVANSGMYIERCQYGYSKLGVNQSKIWSSGTLCITIAANIGKCSIMTFDACFPDSIVGFTPKPNSIFVEFVYYFFNAIQKRLEDNAMGVAQKNINLKILNEMSIPLPPLSLQQSFAEKIEAIEKQKALVQQSISETQTLFDSRMDYYFN